MSGYERWNMKVSRRCLKTASDCADVTWSGAEGRFTCWRRSWQSASRAKFHLHRSLVSPLWGEKPIFGSLSKRNTSKQACCLRAGLPVITAECRRYFELCWPHKLVRLGQKTSNTDYKNDAVARSLSILKLSSFNKTVFGKIVRSSSEQVVQQLGLINYKCMPCLLYALRLLQLTKRKKCHWNLL